MKRIARWARRFGLARAVCIVLLFALVPLRLLDPRPLEELRLRDVRSVPGAPPAPADMHGRSSSSISTRPASSRSGSGRGRAPWWPISSRALPSSARSRSVSTSSLPSPTACRRMLRRQIFAGIDAETRAKLDSLPSNDEVLADAIKHSRVVVGEAGSAIVTPRSETEMALQAGFAVLGPDPSEFLVTFPGLLRNVIADRAGGRRPRAVLHRSGTRRHHPPRAGGHEGAGHVGPVAVDGNAARRHRHKRDPGARGPGRHTLGRGAGPRSADRPQRPNSGSISTNTIQHDTSLPRTCCKATCRPNACETSLSSSALRRPGCSTSRRRRSSRRCRASKSMRRFLKAC